MKTKIERKCIICGEGFMANHIRRMICDNKKCEYKRNSSYISKEANNKRYKKLSAKKRKQKIKEQNGKIREFKMDYEKPFTPVSKGWGYVGVLLSDKKSGEVQCHICGGWYDFLGVHISKLHKTKPKEYRIKYGLGAQTSLASQKVRERKTELAIQRGMNKKYVKNLVAGEGKRRKTTNGKTTEEFRNKNGTCTLQTYDKVYKVFKELGRQPTNVELTWYVGSDIRSRIRRRFGSVKNLYKLISNNL